MQAAIGGLIAMWILAPLMLWFAGGAAIGGIVYAVVGVVNFNLFPNFFMTSVVFFVIWYLWAKKTNTFLSVLFFSFLLIMLVMMITISSEVHGYFICDDMMRTISCEVTAYQPMNGLLNPIREIFHIKDQLHELVLMNSLVSFLSLIATILTFIKKRR